jgi:hypothetical protein
MIFAILYFYDFILVVDTAVQNNNNNEISLHFKTMRLVFMNYSVKLPHILLFTCDLMMALVIEAETCCHLVTLNKINIHNTSCVLTCESLLLSCIHRTQRG